MVPWARHSARIRPYFSPLSGELYLPRLDITPVDPHDGEIFRLVVSVLGIVDRGRHGANPLVRRTSIVPGTTEFRTSRPLSRPPGGELNAFG
jgi:hypothetical protein